MNRSQRSSESQNDSFFSGSSFRNRTGNSMTSVESLLMSCIFALPRALCDLRNKRIRLAAWFVSAGIFVSQLVINLIKIAPRFR